MQAYLYSLHMTSETTGWGLIVGLDDWGDGATWVNGEYRVIRTGDGGSSFQGAGTWKLEHDRLDFFPLAEKRALAFTSQQVYRTTDAGTTWEEGNLPLTSGECIWVRSLTFPDAQHGWLLLEIHNTSSYLLLSTEDGGRTFRQVLRFNSQMPPAPGIGGRSTLQFLDQQTGWITAHPPDEAAITQKHSLYLSCDGGNHWTPQSLPLPPEVKPTCNLMLTQPRFFSRRQGVIAASINHSRDGTPSGFLTFVTQDGGLSWQSRPFVALDYNVLYRAMLMRKPRQLHDLLCRSTPAPRFTDMRFGWVGDSSLALFTTNDGGLSWRPLVSSSPLKEARYLHFLSSRLGWLVTRGKDAMTSSLYKTSDGGITWTPLAVTLL